MNQNKVAKEIVGTDEEIIAKKGVKFTKRLLRTLAANEAAKPRIPIVKRLPFGIEKGAELQVVEEISDPETGDILVPEGSILTSDQYALLEEKGISQINCIDLKRVRIPIEIEDIEGRVICDDLINPETGEILLEGNSHLTKEKIESLLEIGIKHIECVVLDGHGISRSIRETLLADRINTPEEAILDIYRKMRPSSPPTPEVAETFFQIFFSIWTLMISPVWGGLNSIIVSGWKRFLWISERSERRTFSVPSRNLSD